MPSEDKKMLEFNQNRISDKTSSVINANLESLIKKKIDGCKSNSGKSYTTKVDEYITCGYSRSMIWILDGIKNENDICTRVDGMKKFCVCLREYAVKIINFDKKKMIPLTDEQQESYEKTKIFYLYKKKFEDNYTK